MAIIEKNQGYMIVHFSTARSIIHIIMNMVFFYNVMISAENADVSL